MFQVEIDSIERATNKLKETLGKSLLSVIAFGSRVKGDFHGESDLDILVLVRIC